MKVQKDENSLPKLSSVCIYKHRQANIPRRRQALLLPQVSWLSPSGARPAGTGHCFLSIQTGSEGAMLSVNQNTNSYNLLEAQRLDAMTSVILLTM